MPLRADQITDLPGLPKHGNNKYTRQQLHLDTQDVTGRMMTWLQQGNRLEAMLAETKLKDILISLGILTDKMLLLDGQPTQIIGVQQQQKLDEVSTALATLLQQRGLTKQVTLTERKVAIEMREP